MSDIDVLKGAEVTHNLEAIEVFDGLVEDEARDGILYRAYAHYLSRACWHGGRIILRQTSPESEGIFDFILELHKGCNGQWDKLLDSSVTQEHLNAWLEFAGMFLSSLGNYYVSTKFSALTCLYVVAWLDRDR
jgi:dipeptidyl-peptidase-3